MELGTGLGRCKNVYLTFPNSYSVLTPFAYSYLEELIRSTTSEYGRELVNTDGTLKKNRKVSINLIDLAIEENKDSKPEFVAILPEIKSYFSQSEPANIGDNRHSVAHGYMHSRFQTEIIWKVNFWYCKTLKVCWILNSLNILTKYSSDAA